MLAMLNQGAFKRAVALLGAAIVLGSAVAGCGGGGDSTTAASQELTKAQFIKQAAAICVQTSEEKEARLIEAIESEGGKGLLAASNSELEKMASEVVLPLYGETISQLQNLSPPSKDKAKVAKILTAYETALEEAESDPSKSLEGNPFAKADDAATEYGLICNL